MSLPTDTAAARPFGRLAGLTQFEAVRLAEQARPLDDVQAMREAHAAHDQTPARLLDRAARLAPGLGIAQALAGGRERLIIVALSAAFLVGLLSYSLVLGVVGADRRINALAALLAVLGPHFLSLLIWLVALLFGGSAGGSGGGLVGGLVGGLAMGLLNLSTRLPGLGGQASRLTMQASLEVIARSRGLSAWLFGLLTHLVWALAFVFTLLGLLFAFSFQSYQLTWETTILDGATFARFAEAVGRLPALFGFVTPAGQHLLDGHGDHRAWAIWLLGCILVYGLAMRVALALISGLRAWHLLSGLRLPQGNDPYVRRLIERFEALQAAQLIDAESPAGHARAVPPQAADLRADLRAGLALIGFELPAGQPWPPFVPGPARLLTSLSDGSVADKRRLLARLQALVPAQLLLVCNAAASPDRATERFLRAAASLAGQTAVLLAGAATHPESAQRWRDWLTQIDLHPVFADEAEAAAWAKTGAQQND